MRISIVCIGFFEEEENVSDFFDQEEKVDDGRKF